jgi:hypothetical protein
MLIEYTIKIEKGGVTVSQRVNPDSSGQGEETSGEVVLGSQFLPGGGPGGTAGTGGGPGGTAGTGGGPGGTAGTGGGGPGSGAVIVLGPIIIGPSEWACPEEAGDKGDDKDKNDKQREVKSPPPNVANPKAKGKSPAPPEK